MALINLTLPVIGQPNATEDPKTLTALTTIQTGINGNIDETNMPTATLQRLGLNSGSQVGRGKTNIATTESTSSASYVTLTTPDQVTGIVLPTDGVIAVLFSATWQNSIAGAGRAAIFLGANQVKLTATQTAGAPQVHEITGPGGAAAPQYIHSHAGGLVGANTANNYNGDVTTGQLVADSGTAGGPAYIFAAAGTYTVSIQFKATSGSVTANSRKLWVWTIGF